MHRTHDTQTRALIVLSYITLLSPFAFYMQLPDKFFLLLGAAGTAVGVALLPKAIRDWR
jgi:hypothetical protein